MQRQIQDFPNGGRGLSQVWIFHTWTFHSGTNNAVHGQSPSGQNAGGQNTCQNCRRGQNTSHFMGQEGQNANLINLIKCQSYQNLTFFNFIL